MFDRSRLALVLLLITVFLPEQFVRADEPIILRVLTYNINHGEGIDSRIDLKRTTEVIRSAEPDLVLLQEVDQGVARSGRLDQARLLADRLEMEHVFGGNQELFGGSFGNAILSRFPILESTNHDLPTHSGRGEPRGLLDAVIRLSHDGPDLQVLSTQFDHRWEASDQLLAAEAIDFVTSAPPASILGGDLKDDYPSRTLVQLNRNWGLLSADPPPTVPASEPSSAFDHLLVAPPKAWRLIELRTIDDGEASDHRAVLAVLRFLPEHAEPPGP